MPIGTWLICAFLAVVVLIFGIGFGASLESKTGMILGVLIAVLVIAAIFGGFLWYYQNTAAGQRAMIDQKSNLNSGLERTVTVYTANGEVIAQYTGLIDIDTNDGGYVKFDFEGKRYIYYNCFIETIAEIE